MEDYKKNGVYNESLSKRDKRRQQISSRLNKLELSFNNDKDNYYKLSLQELQNTLATLQQGTNDEFVHKKEDLEEVRDYELTKLRLWEEYQVKRIETEYNGDILKAKQNHDKMIKLIKEKLYDKLEKQIKQLKDDKLLLNLVNANSWKGGEKGSNNLNGPISSHLSVNEIAISQHERRSLRKREVSSRFTAGEADDLSDDGRFSGNSSAHYNGGNGSSHGNGYFSSNGGAGGYSSATKRRRHYATRYSSNDESSNRNGGDAGSGGAGSGGGAASSGSGYTSHGGNHGHYGSISSGNDSNLSDKDYDTLNNIIMGNEDGGVSLVLLDKGNASGGDGIGGGSSHSKANTRGSHKQFTGLPGLRPEELNDDLSLLRNAIKRDK